MSTVLKIATFLWFADLATKLKKTKVIHIDLFFDTAERQMF